LTDATGENLWGEGPAPEPVGIGDATGSVTPAAAGSPEATDGRVSTSLDWLDIAGGTPLQGDISISGSKNAALPILAATLCVPGRHILHNVPDLLDCQILIKVLEALGAVAEPLSPTSWRIDTSGIHCNHPQPPQDLVGQMRASVLVMGPLLGRCKRAMVTMPGGCSLGARPINFHLAGFQQLGAQLVPGPDDSVMIDAGSGLVGTTIELPLASVGATENLLMAAVFAEGITIIRNAAREPEVVDLGHFLIAMGADIEGLGERDITIRGGQPLQPAAEYRIIPDRIEAGSFLCAFANTGGTGRLLDVHPADLERLLEVLDLSGCTLAATANSISITAPERLKAVGICTGPYPAFATDHQPLWMACLATATAGVEFEIVLETLFERRFNQVEGLRLLGADIDVLSQVACVRPVETLQPGEVHAPDIRGAMGLVVAALRIPGVTRIIGLHHLRRGYERYDEKLRALGAKLRTGSATPIAMAS